MDGYVAAGTAAALVVIFAAGVRKRDLPEVSGAVLAFFGANSATASVKLGRLLLLNHVGLLAGTKPDRYASLGTGDLTFFVGGAFAALLVGLVTFRDGAVKMFVDG